MITPIVPTTMDRLHVLVKMASPEMDLFVLVILYFFCSCFHYSFSYFHFHPVDSKQPLFVLRKKVLETCRGLNGCRLLRLTIRSLVNSYALSLRQWLYYFWLFFQVSLLHWSTWFIWCNINFCFTWFFLQISMSAWQMSVHVMQELYVPTPTVLTLVRATTASQEMGHTVKVTCPSYRLRVRFFKKIQNGFCVSLLNGSIQDLSDHGASKKPKYPPLDRFLWRTMIRQILDWSV